MGLLASMASASDAEPQWNDDGLADDVATISYEQALRTHGRAPGSASDTGAVPQSPQPDSFTQAESGASPSQPSADRSSTTAAVPMKKASITIRMSEPECAQVRRRAAEAGLTISAYLRSCTLEVETLRTQVKQTVAQLRSSPSPAPETDGATATGGWIKDIGRRYWPFGRSQREAIGLNPANPFAPLHYSQR